MRSLTRFGRSPVWTFLLLAVVCHSAAPAIGFEYGEVQANDISQSDGMTTSATEVIAMTAVSPPFTDPPLPPTYPPARSTLNGTMSSVDLSSQGSISGALSQYFSTGWAQVDFVDNLVVNAPGVPDGTDLIVEVGWLVSGRAEFSSTSTIRSRSRIQLEVDGIVLDPNDPVPPKQQWIRDRSNFTSERLDTFGLVTFEYLVEAGMPVFDGNIRMRSITNFFCGGPGSVFTGSYSASSNVELTVRFFGATNVKTIDGRPIFKWTTNSQSGLIYGSRDDDPPPTPELTVSPSPAGEKLVNLSWATVATEYYIVQASDDGTTWNHVTEVLGTGSSVSIDLLQDYPETTYRLIADIGAGNPGTAPVPPAMCVTRSAFGDLRVAWPSNHWESYVLNEVDGSGNKTQVDAADGDGGAIWFDFPTSAQQRLFQVEAILK